jgi:hypothetical protein
MKIITGSRPGFRIALAALGLATLAAVLVGQAQSAEPSWTVVRGELEVRPSPLGPWEDVPDGEALRGEWSVRTKMGSSGVLANGSQRIELAPDTYLSARSQADPRRFSGTLLALGRGAAVFDVWASSVHVVTPFFTVDSSGTSFAIEVEDRHAAVTVGEGSVDVTYLREDAPLRLERGETAVVDVQASADIELASAERSDSARARTTGRKHLAWMGRPATEARAAAGGSVDSSLAPGSAVEAAPAAVPWGDFDEPGDVGLAPDGRAGFWNAQDDAAADSFDGLEQGGSFPGEDPGDMPDDDPGDFPDDGPGDFPDEGEGEIPDDEPDGGGDDEPGEVPDFPDDGPDDFPDDDPDDGPVDDDEPPDVDPIPDFPDDDDRPDDLPPWWNDNPLGGGDDEDEEDDRGSGNDDEEDDEENDDGVPD